jgi:hypothetical protein
MVSVITSGSSASQPGRRQPAADLPESSYDSSVFTTTVQS